jgi:hypothetical protein
VDTAARGARHAGPGDGPVHGHFLGLAPLSAAATGALLRHLSVGELFCGGGALLLAAAVAAALLTDIPASGKPCSITLKVPHG